MTFGRVETFLEREGQYSWRWVILRDGDGRPYNLTSYPTRHLALTFCPHEGYHVERVKMRRTTLTQDERIDE